MVVGTENNGWSKAMPKNLWYRERNTLDANKNRSYY